MSIYACYVVKGIIFGILCVGLYPMGVGFPWSLPVLCEHGVYFFLEVSYEYFWFIGVFHDQLCFFK